MPSSAVQTCARSEEHTSELQSHDNLVCRLLLEKNDDDADVAPPPQPPPATRPPPPQPSPRPGPRGALARSPAGATGSVRRAFAFFLKIRATPQFPTFPRTRPIQS